MSWVIDDQTFVSQDEHIYSEKSPNYLATALPVLTSTSV